MSDKTAPSWAKDLPMDEVIFISLAVRQLKELASYTGYVWQNPFGRAKPYTQDQYPMGLMSVSSIYNKLLAEPIVGYYTIGAAQREAFLKLE